MTRRLVLVLACVLARAVVAAAQPPIPLSLALPDRPAAGARLFVEKSCVRCHSLGSRESRVGPDLGRMMFAGTVLDLAGAFWNHAPVMHEKMQDLKIQPPTMTPGEMADIVAVLTVYRYYLTQIGEVGNPAAGGAVFAAKGCAGCHAEGASTWDKPGPDLTRYRRRFSAVLLAQAMWNHGGEMAAVMRGRGVRWPQFVGREMGDLIAYLQAGNRGAASERVYFEPGSPRRGQGLMKTKGCLTCHAVAGVGGRAGPDLGRQPKDLVGSVAQIAGLMWNHSQGMSAEFTRRRLARVSFSGQEMADIIAYLFFVNYAQVSGTPAAGGRLFVEKCAACHRLGARSIGPDLLATTGLDDPMGLVASMWNHAPRMEQELRKQRIAWPQFKPGQAADLAAFLLERRSAARVAGTR